MTMHREEIKMIKVMIQIIMTIMMTQIIMRKIIIKTRFLILILKAIKNKNKMIILAIIYRTWKIKLSISQINIFIKNQTL